MPTPGGPASSDHRARAAAAHHLEPPLGATAPDGEVLDDPLLDLVEPVVVRVEHGAGGDHVGGVLGRDAPRQLEHGVEPGPDPGRLRALVAGALELVDLAQQRLAYGVGDVGGLDPAAVVVGAVGLALAELLADGGELLAQQELPLALLHALADVLTDLVGELDLGEVLPRPADQGLEPRLHVGGLEQLPLAVHREVRRVAGGVGDRSRVGHLVDRVDDLPGLAPLEHGDDQPLVLLGELAGPVGDVLVDRLDLDPQRRTRPGHAAADPAAALGLEHGCGAAAAEAADLLDGGDHAVRRVAVLEPRGHEEPAIAARAGGVDGGPGGLVELDRHHHARQHDEVGDEQDGKTLVGHGVLAFANLSDVDSTRASASRVPAAAACSSRANMPRAAGELGRPDEAAQSVPPSVLAKRAESGAPLCNPGGRRAWVCEGVEFGLVVPPRPNRRYEPGPVSVTRRRSHQDRQRSHGFGSYPPLPYGTKAKQKVWPSN